jgi:hypothetical protein
MQLSDVESKLHQMYAGDNQVSQLLNLKREVTTFEEARDLIVHLRDALATVFSDKRKLEVNLDSLNNKLADLT